MAIRPLSLAEMTELNLRPVEKEEQTHPEEEQIHLLDTRMTELNLRPVEKGEQTHPEEEQTHHLDTMKKLNLRPVEIAPKKEEEPMDTKPNN